MSSIWTVPLVFGWIPGCYVNLLNLMRTCGNLWELSAWELNAWELMGTHEDDDTDGSFILQRNL